MIQDLLKTRYVSVGLKNGNFGRKMRRKAPKNPKEKTSKTSNLSSMVLGFKVYCETIFTLFPGCEIRVNCTNQDNLEQFFGRQRAQNAQNNNPTELRYGEYIYYFQYKSVH